jgi:hypothetical protein
MYRGTPVFSLFCCGSSCNDTTTGIAVKALLSSSVEPGFVSCMSLKLSCAGSMSRGQGRAPLSEQNRRDCEQQEYQIQMLAGHRSHSPSVLKDQVRQTCTNATSAAVAMTKSEDEGY